ILSPQVNQGNGRHVMRATNRLKVKSEAPERTTATPTSGGKTTSSTRPKSRGCSKGPRRGGMASATTSCLSGSQPAAQRASAGRSCDRANLSSRVSQDQPRTLRPRLHRLDNKGLVRSSSRTIRFLSIAGTSSSDWRRALKFQHVLLTGVYCGRRAHGLRSRTDRSHTQTDNHGGPGIWGRYELSYLRRTLRRTPRGNRGTERGAARPRVRHYRV